MTMRFLLAFAIFASALFTRTSFATDSVKVAANGDFIVITVPRTTVPCDVNEVAANSLTNRLAVFRLEKRQTSIPRFDGQRDRIYSGFTLSSNNEPAKAIHFVEQFKNVSKNSTPYPKSKSKKGLQVQMIDDALALGVKHAALNFDLGNMVALEPGTNDFKWTMDGRLFHFRRSYIEYTDGRIQALSQKGIVVTLILLNYENANSQQNKVLLHPTYDAACPQDLSAFNTKTSDGLAWFKACMEFLADRYSEKSFPHGRVANYIVGNEVNSHWWWANMGRVSMNDFVEDYERTVRICNTAVRKYSSTARVFVSLEHHWNIRYPAGDEMQSFPARAFIDRFTEVAKRSGNYDWNLAFHPYPENLFNPKTWQDKSATFSPDTPRITFKNLQLLTQYFQGAPLLYNGKPRHIILSEQGFHSDGTAAGEQLQAAAYCYAYYKSEQLSGIDAFILHRHVDHPAEGGLNLGLWRRNGNSAEPLTKKPIYEVFRTADTDDWKKSFQFALPIIGIQSWKDSIQTGSSKK